MSAPELELAVLYAYNPPGVGEEAARVKAQVMVWRCGALCAFRPEKQLLILHATAALLYVIQCSVSAGLSIALL